MQRLLSALATGMFLALGTATPALADDNIALVVEPQLIQTGGSVKLTANNCKNTTATATFSPSTLDPVILNQSIGNNSVSGSVTIPHKTIPGVYTITATCSGKDVKAAQNLYVYQPAPAPSKAPATGGIALGGTSGATTAAAGIGLAALGGILGLLAWRRHARPAD